jgi:plastocyanin
MRVRRLSEVALVLCPLLLVAALMAAPPKTPAAPGPERQTRPAATIPVATRAATPTPVPGEVRVSVWIQSAGKKAAGAGAVVWIPGSAAPQQAPKKTIASKGKRFEPRVSAVPAGATVEFPNLDRIHHNVFSLSERAKFDLGLYKNGASKPWTFPNAGLVRIYCNIHPQMAAYLMVVDGHNYAQAGTDGIAVLSGVPPGRHPLKAWEERGGEWTGSVEVLSGKTAPVTVSLDASAYREAPHTRKDGTGYPPPDDDDNRY